jgi:hypothetical protein
MKKYAFYLNAEKLIFKASFENIIQAQEYCKDHFPEKYWNIEIRKIY